MDPDSLPENLRGTRNESPFKPECPRCLPGGGNSQVSLAGPELPQSS
jgi:hypothetical protein